MKDNKVQQDLASIRNLMERSSKFISLSGLSGVLAGIYALLGAGYIYIILNEGAPNQSTFSVSGDPQAISKVFLVAIIILVASVITGFVFSARKAKKTGQQIWGAASRLLLSNMVVPLVAGGVLMMVLVSRDHIDMAVAVSLVFYGLALTAASNYSLTDIRYLGLSEIVLGLLAAIYPACSLLFWAIGFGVLHIVYGSVMYLKYDK